MFVFNRRSERALAIVGMTVRTISAISPKKPAGLLASGLAAIILAKLAPLRGGQFNPFFLECVERCLAHCCSETVLHALVTEFADCFIEMRWHRSPPSKLTVIVPFGKGIQIAGVPVTETRRRVGSRAAAGLSASACG